VALTVIQNAVLSEAIVTESGSDAVSLFLYYAIAHQTLLRVTPFI
jgi:hypothetical protein